MTQNSRMPRDLKAGAIVLINYNDNNWNGRDILKSEKLLFAARNGIPLISENEHDWDEFLLIKFNKSGYDDILERLENANLKEFQDKDIHRRAGLSRTKLIVFSPYKEFL